MDSAALLDLLGNENRRRILRLLARRPCYVTEISEYLGVSPKAVIDHLRKLEEAGLVESHVDDGRRKYFSIARNLRLEVNVSPYDFGTKSAYSASPNLDITSWRYVSLNVERGEQAADESLDDATDEVGAELAEDSADEPVDSSASPADAEADAETAADAKAETADDTAAASDAETAGEANGGTDAAADGRLPQAFDLGATDDRGLAALAADLRRLERLENELSMAQRWVQGRLTGTLDEISAHFEGVDGRFYAELLRGLAQEPATAERLSRRVEAPPEVVADALAGLAAHGVVERDGDRWRLVPEARE